MSNLYNQNIEQSFLATVIQHPDTWGEVASHLSPKDFSEINKVLYNIISHRLSGKQSVDTVILGETIKGLGITFDAIEIGDYLMGLQYRPVNKDNITDLAKEIKRHSVRRELINRAEEFKKDLLLKPDITFEQMNSKAEKSLSGVTTQFYKAETTDLFGDIIDSVEERGNNPISADSLGLMGPFQSINKTLGALCYPGAFVTVAARSGNSKSSFGFFYQTSLALMHDLPLLLMDCGEMTVERIQHRAVCCFSKGRVPLWAVKSGEWRKNKEWTHIIRDEIWPIVKKLRVDFVGVGSMSPKEKIAFLRRYYYNKVGRDNHLLILDDYLKGVEAVGKNGSEHQAIGYYVADVKTLITEEIKASFWTSVQQNRGGSYMGKQAKDVVDSDTNIGLSDRIVQQSDWAFLMRRKIPEELALEQNMFGNMVFKPVKMRELLGRDFEKSLAPIKLANGGFVENYFNIDYKSFWFDDRGDVRSMYESLGKMSVNLDDVAKVNKEQNAL